MGAFVIVRSLAARAPRHSKKIFFLVSAPMDNRARSRSIIHGAPNFGPAATAPAGPAPTALSYLL